MTEVLKGESDQSKRFCFKKFIIGPSVSRRSNSPLSSDPLRGVVINNTLQINWEGVGNSQVMKKVVPTTENQVPETRIGDFSDFEVKEVPSYVRHPFLNSPLD